jgi:hypothetical protein
VVWWRGREGNERIKWVIWKQSERKVREGSEKIGKSATVMKKNRKRRRSWGWRWGEGGVE